MEEILISKLTDPTTVVKIGSANIPIAAKPKKSMV